jgi:hypothetical protein
VIEKPSDKSRLEISVIKIVDCPGHGPGSLPSVFALSYVTTSMKKTPIFQGRT